MITAYAEKHCTQLRMLGISSLLGWEDSSSPDPFLSLTPRCLATAWPYLHTPLSEYFLPVWLGLPGGLRSADRSPLSLLHRATLLFLLRDRISCIQCPWGCHTRKCSQIQAAHLQCLPEPATYCNIELSHTNLSHMVDHYTPALTLRLYGPLTRLSTLFLLLIIIITFYYYYSYYFFNIIIIIIIVIPLFNLFNLFLIYYWLYHSELIIPALLDPQVTYLTHSLCGSRLHLLLCGSTLVSHSWCACLFCVSPLFPPGLPDYLCSIWPCHAFPSHPSLWVAYPVPRTFRVPYPSPFISPGTLALWLRYPPRIAYPAHCAHGITYALNTLGHLLSTPLGCLPSSLLSVPSLAVQPLANVS